LKANPDVAQSGVCPLIHYLEEGRGEGRSALPDGGHALEVDPLDEAQREFGALSPAPSIRLIAYYFPSIGFASGRRSVDWTRVRNARPMFHRHRQPHEPGALGEYDPRDPNTFRRQIELARQHHIAGFCFCLEPGPVERGGRAPLDWLVAHPDIEFGFCLCYGDPACRTGKRGEKRTLQQHKKEPAQRDSGWLWDRLRYLRDPRYIRVDDRPLVLVDRPDALTDSAATAQHWRDECRREQAGELYLAGIENGPGFIPSAYGFDGAIECPLDLPIPTLITAGILTDKRFAGVIHSYAEMAARSKAQPRPDHDWFRGVVTAWDETPRRGLQAAMVAGSSPERYFRWLRLACADTARSMPREKRLVFIAAWNGWAQGAHLEPDQAFGYAYLNRTSHALAAHRPRQSGRVLMIIPDALRLNSPSRLRDFLEWLGKRTAIDVRILLLSEGEMLKPLHGVRPPFTLPATRPGLSPSDEVAVTIEGSCEGKPDLIVGDTIEAGSVYPWLASWGVPMVTYVHYLAPGSDAGKTRGGSAAAPMRSDRFIAESPEVVTALRDRWQIAEHRIHLLGNTVSGEVLAPRANSKEMERTSEPVCSGGGLPHRTAEVELFHVFRDAGRLRPLVSVIVPNYNYARYLSDRLNSILVQSFQDFELIVLDDASTDDSLDVIEAYGVQYPLRVIRNRINSGSVFAQWKKGIESAAGQLVWIAEADDVADPAFLETLVPAFSDPAVTLAYCDSHTMDDDGRVTERFYQDFGHFRGLGYPAARWREPYQNRGPDEIQHALAIKNTIPNASAVLMTREALRGVDLGTAAGFRTAGDWFTYVSVLEHGDVSYTPDALNVQRRHPSSVVAAVSHSAGDTLRDYAAMHRYVAARFPLLQANREKMVAMIQDSLRPLWPDVTEDELRQYYDPQAILAPAERQSG
jgi:hypothetical protein